jgi:TM2 domain-containing membrane protein YozV
MLMQSMTDQQRMIFLSQFNSVRKDTTIAVLLALFLGGFGAHHFYMGNIGIGVLYAVFFWTLIPHLIAIIECFFLAARVRNYNATRANLIAAQVRNAFPARK